MSTEKDLKEKKLSHAKLSWDLLGYKLFYYYPDKVHSSWHKKLDIPDSEYDELEREYLRLCLELGVDNTVAGQTEVDNTAVPGKGMTQLKTDRASVQLVMRRSEKRRAK